MSVIVIGAKGMLGSALCALLESKGIHFVGVDLPEIDITNIESVEHFFFRFPQSPRVVINVAAYTDVNGAESNESTALAVNAHGSENIARLCRHVGAKCFYISTDYVFDGNKVGIYDEYDDPCPLNAYGRTKLQGEIALAKILPTQHVILRTSWLYGAGGKHFPGAMLQLAKEGRDLKIIHDQVGSPTYTVDLAHAILQLLDCSNACGIYHVTNSGYCSWFEFAQCIFEKSGVIPKTLAPCLASEYATAAARPLNSRLSPKRLIDIGVGPLPSWQDAITRFLMTLD